ncbi:MAG: 50S ribosomal protein L30 [Actinobacteria bacterium]|uniref:Large ribosomal subunit protein uL30 n=1 Tax=Candidatus Hakubella thermalkaliphila TaxID=2754717 RepID=A0A6V8Q2Q0_9ACTN|nr:50S ribosomal protein L30 [Candidatus Hakubella thermalkaliphila]MBT9170089.1 50S ribosomal protein L30 [Actinomycetota bacterium]GFP38783.1 large subunit ribosomal protein L30 [Candidatus Hakubella thermalkaliphila]
MGKLRITQKKSLIGSPQRHRNTIRSLGLRRVNHTVIHDDRQEIRGMVLAVRHLVEVEKMEN